MKLKVLLHPAEEGGFWAEVPGLPGCVSEGEDVTATLSKIREAVEGWIEVATAEEKGPRKRGQAHLIHLISLFTEHSGN